MSLKQRLDEDLKKAMKARDAAALSALRLLKTEITKKEIELEAAAREGPPADGAGAKAPALRVLDDAEIQRLIEKALKQRGESAEQFRKGGRPELADQEDREAAFLKGYLPARLSDQELDALVAQAVAETGATSPRDIGNAMKAAMAKVAGRADGKAVSELVKKKLSAAPKPQS